MRAECELAAITTGADGLRHHHRPTTCCGCRPFRSTAVIDTTGAGDLFAAGFLHGLTSGRDLYDCGMLGSIAAAEVIAHVGPRPLVELRTLVTDG